MGAAALDFLRVLAAGFAGGVAVWWLGRAATTARPRRRPGQPRELAWPARMRGAALLMLALALAVTAMATQASPDQRLVAAAVASSFLLSALYVSYAVFCYRVWLTTEGIGFAHWFGQRFLRWDDVTGGGYNPWLQAFHVSAGRQRVWYSPMQGGIPLLHRYLHRYLRRRFRGANAKKGWRR